MIDIPMISIGSMDRQSILDINRIKVQGAKDRNSVTHINKPCGASPQNNTRNNSQSHQVINTIPVQQQSSIPKMVIPQLQNIVRKGQKVSLENMGGKLRKVKACLGWNVKNSVCDVDVSAFMLSGNKVISDDWFVFYGHPKSPDESVVVSSVNGLDRQAVSIDFTKINTHVEKIVFVLTINEALEKKLNFSMIQDAYIRILDAEKSVELVSFLMDEYYSNVTSMMIGEIYKHNGSWKFNAIGNGVARDLAGLCELYGVQVD